MDEARERAWRQWGGARWLALLVAVVLVWMGAGGLWAEEAAAAIWEPTGLGERAVQLFTPSSGALFAWTGRQLMRSDDGGLAWGAIELPDEADEVAVHPADHTVVFAAGRSGLYKSDDDAVSWRLSYATPGQSRYGMTIAASPADPRLAYLDVHYIGSYTLLRSRDGGESWEKLRSGRGESGCNYVAWILQPHPTDDRRVYRASSCRVGDQYWAPLLASVDRGESWSAAWDPAPMSAPRSSWQRLFPARLVGGQGTVPQRFYLGACSISPGARPPGSKGGTLLRSDDDGETWTSRMSFDGRTCSGRFHVPLAYDPAAPDRVFLVDSDVVKASADGGETWTDLAHQDLGTIYDLALGLDGANLYAATQSGVFRWPLTERRS